MSPRNLAFCFALGGMPNGAMFSSTPCRANPWSSKLGVGFLGGGSIQPSSEVCAFSFLTSNPGAGEMFEVRTKGLEVRLDLRVGRIEGISRASA